MVQSIIVDTNVLVSALLNPFGPSTLMMELCFQGQYKLIIGTALFLEYEDVFSREKLLEKCLLTPDEREQFLNDFLSISQWVRIYYSWRPNLKDEGDNHIIELAIAGGASTIVTNNVRDFKQSDLIFPEISIVTPNEFLKESK